MRFSRSTFLRNTEPRSRGAPFFARPETARRIPLPRWRARAARDRGQGDQHSSPSVTQLTSPSDFRSKVRRGAQRCQFGIGRRTWDPEQRGSRSSSGWPLRWWRSSWRSNRGRARETRRASRQRPFRHGKSSISRNIGKCFEDRQIVRGNPSLRDTSLPDTSLPDIGIG